MSTQNEATLGLTETADSVLRAHYLRRDEGGNRVEDGSGMLNKADRSRKPPLWLMCALLLAVGWSLALAQPPPHLTAEQEAVARRLDQTFIAPCCFANTLAEHRSPVAEELRQELRSMLAGGATETQVVDAFVAEYGERILAAPRPQGFNLLAYVLPAVAVGVGLLVIAFVLRRRGPQTPSVAPPPEIADQVKARFEAELAHFDE